MKGKHQKRIAQNRKVIAALRLKIDPLYSLKKGIETFYKRLVKSYKEVSKLLEKNAN